VKVILRADVSNVGKKGDIVDVANGFARNYLVPKGLALRATEGNVQQAGSMRRARDLRDAKDRGAAEEVARVLVPAIITVRAKSGSEGRLFGSVTTTDVAVAVEEQTGIEVDRRKLQLDEPIKTVGTHQIPTKLHPDVEFAITVEVVSGTCRASGVTQAPAVGATRPSARPLTLGGRLPNMCSAWGTRLGCGQLGLASTRNPHACALHSHKRFGGE
jgi:large subunit ribosomal protein L9